MTKEKEKRYNGFMNLKMSPDEFSSLLEEKRKISDAEAALFAKSVGDNQAIKNPQTRQIALYSYSVSLFYSTRFDEAEKIIKSFIFTYMNYPFMPFYIDCFVLLSLLAYYKKRYHLSLFYAQQALSLSEMKKCRDRYTAVYGNMAAPYRDLQENDKCLECLDQAIAYCQYSSDPSARYAILYNRALVLAALNRYEEARAAILEAEKESQDKPTPPIFAAYFPLSKAEISLALHESVDLHALAMDFLNSPLQQDPSLSSLLLDEDESAFLLLVKYDFIDDAELFLAKIEAIQAASPALTSAIFIAKGKAAIAEKRGDALAAGKDYQELSSLYEKQTKELSTDFEENTKLHFDFVRVNSAYQKAQKRAQKLLEENDTDALTGLANRRALDKEKKRFPALAKKQSCFALALLDYDHFKDINDGYGYQTGDQALHLGGVYFHSLESPSVRVFRYGGDEFVFALSVNKPEEASTFFAQVKRGLEAVELLSPEGNKIPLSCCIGYGLFQGSFDNYAQALKMANEAIHAAKKIGRGNIVSVVD